MSRDASASRDIRMSVSPLIGRRPITKRQAPRTDIAAVAGTQIPHIVGRSAGDLGGVGHDAQIAGRREPTFVSVDDVQPGQGGAVGRVDTDTDLAVEAEFGTLQRSRLRSSSSGTSYSTTNTLASASSTTVASAPSQPMSRRRTSAATRATNRCRTSASAGSASASAPDACWTRRRRRSAHPQG